MAENVKLFRNAVGGFNKEDVAQYIERINFEFNRDISIAKNETAELKSKLEKAEQELQRYKTAGVESERFEAKITVLEENLAKSEANAKQLKEKLIEAEERINTQNDALDKLCVENENLKSAKEQAALPTADPEIAEKARLYDQMSSKIGVLIMDANRNADGLLSSAKDEAAVIIADAEKEASRIIDEANIKAESIHSDACKRAANFENEYRSIFEKYSSAITSTLKNIENDINGCENELKAKAESLYNNNESLQQGE